MRHNTFFMKCLTPSVVVRRGSETEAVVRLSGRLAGPPPRQWRATIPIDFCSVKAFVTPDTESFSSLHVLLFFAPRDGWTREATPAKPAQSIARLELSRKRADRLPQL